MTPTRTFFVSFQLAIGLIVLLQLDSIHGSSSTTIDPTATTSTTATTATTTTPTTPASSATPTTPTDSTASTTPTGSTTPTIPTGSTTPIGSTNPTSSTTPTTPIGSTTPKNLVQAKIHSVYCNCLNRCADKDGMNYWAGRYAANNGNMTDIVLGILYSSEYERKHMTGNLDQPATLYKHILLRNPDQSGANTWNYKMKYDGWNWKNIAFALVNSPEYKQKFGSGKNPGSTTCNC